MLHVDQNLLEVGDLPIERLAEIADKESRQPQAVYSTHKWFARRLGTSMRALLVGLQARDIDQFWQLFQGNPHLDGNILDPFVGGGTTVTEAARLGLKTIGVDIDPVAVAITGFQMNLPTLKSVVPLIEKLQSNVGSKVAGFHEVEGPDGDSWTAVHHFWVQSVNCLQCNHRYDLHPHYVLAETPKTKTKTVLCKDCGSLSDVKITAKFLSCKCGSRTDLRKGTVDNGRTRCPVCDHEEDVIKIARKTGRPPHFELFAHEIISDPARRKIPMVDRLIVPATEVTKNRYKASEALANIHLAELPDEAIGINHQDSRLVSYNRTEISSLFNGRQRLHLSLLLKAHKTLKGEDRGAAGIAISDHLRTNNMLCGYATGWRRLRPLFAIRGWHHVVRPVELNPWLDGIGRGTFINALQRVERARKGATQHRGCSATDLVEFSSAEIHQGSSTRLKFVEDNSVDLVLTDPPYFDKLSYTELADFFRPWLKKLKLTKSGRNMGDQLGALAVSDGEKFVERLTICLIEATRALKLHGRFIFTYQGDAEGWLALAQALYRSGLSPITCFPLLGDAGSGDHKRVNSKRWDAVLCLEKPDQWKRRRKRVLRCDIEDLDWAESVSAKFDDVLGQSKIPFEKSDRLNLEFAALTLASTRDRDRHRSAPELSKVLKTNAAVRQESSKPIHS